MLNEERFPQRVRFIEVQTESYQYVKTISWRKRIHSLLFVAVRQLWASQSDCCQQRSNDTPATSIDQNWHGVHTHSFHEHQSGEQKAGRSCIYQNNINHQRRHHVCPVLASHPGRLDDDINNNWRETWSEGTCDHQSIIEHEPRVKTGPALLYPGLIRCSSGDWGIMMERPVRYLTRQIRGLPEHRSSQTKHIGQFLICDKVSNGPKKLFLLDFLKNSISGSSLASYENSYIW